MVCVAVLMCAVSLIMSVGLSRSERLLAAKVDCKCCVSCACLSATLTVNYGIWSHISPISRLKIP